MSKMKALLENIGEREEEIIQILVLAKETRPAFYGMVCETPSLITVTSLALILLVTGYLSTKIKS